MSGVIFLLISSFLFLTENAKLKMILINQTVLVSWPGNNGTNKQILNPFFVSLFFLGFEVWGCFFDFFFAKILESKFHKDYNLASRTFSHSH